MPAVDASVFLCSLFLNWLPHRLVTNRATRLVLRTESPSSGMSRSRRCAHSCRAHLARDAWQPAKSGKAGRHDLFDVMRQTGCRCDLHRLFRPGALRGLTDGIVMPRSLNASGRIRRRVIRPAPECAVAPSRGSRPGQQKLARRTVLVDCPAYDVPDIGHVLPFVDQ